jgi:hypothetical protein
MNVCCKSLPQQRKLSSKGTKGKKPLKESIANPKLPSAMTQANPKFVLGKLMLTVDALQKVGQLCVELHNYYMNNYKSGQDIMMLYMNNYKSGTRTCINVRTDICTTSAVVRPHDVHIRADTSLCPYGHVCLPTQAAHEPSRSFAHRYGIDTPMNHTL